MILMSLMSTPSRRLALKALTAFMRLDEERQQQFVALLESAAAIAPPPAQAADDPRACLAHLLSFPMRVGTIGEAIAVARINPDGMVARQLNDHGLMWDDDKLLMAIWHGPIFTVWRGTPWERSYIQTLSSLPGAHTTAIITLAGGLRSKAVVLPAALLDLPVIIEGETAA